MRCPLLSLSDAPQEPPRSQPRFAQPQPGPGYYQYAEAEPPPPPPRFTMRPPPGYALVPREVLYAAQHAQPPPADGRGFGIPANIPPAPDYVEYPPAAEAPQPQTQTQPQPQQQPPPVDAPGSPAALVIDEPLPAQGQPSANAVSFTLSPAPGEAPVVGSPSRAGAHPRDAAELERKLGEAERQIDGLKQRLENTTVEAKQLQVCVRVRES
jgi:hypothetical protein